MSLDILHEELAYFKRLRSKAFYQDAKDFMDSIVTEIEEEIAENID